MFLFHVLLFLLFILHLLLLLFLLFLPLLLFLLFLFLLPLLLFLLLLSILPLLLFYCFYCFCSFYYFVAFVAFAAFIILLLLFFIASIIFCGFYYFLLPLIFFVISIIYSIYATFHFALFIDYSILLAGNDFKIDSPFFFTHKTYQLGSLPTGIKNPAASNGVSNLQRCRAAGYLTLAAVAKCLQAATWLVAHGNKPFWQKNGKP